MRIGYDEQRLVTGDNMSVSSKSSSKLAQAAKPKAIEYLSKGRD